MTDLAHDGQYRVAFVPTIADLAAPTVAEIGAGVDMECRITPTGLQREWSTERKDTSKLCSTFSTQSSGRRSVSLQIVYVREESDTTGLENALVYKADGFLVVRDDEAADNAWAATDKCEVYPVQCDQPSKSSPAANEDQTITVGFSMTGEPELEAVVAA
ncbi:MAG: hypothetical protein ACRDYV_23130 [Acidimicrobiia bacterium]